MSNGSAPDVTGFTNQDMDTPLGGGGGAFSIGRGANADSRPTIKPTRKRLTKK